MLPPFLIAAALFFCSLLSYGAAILLIVRMMVSLHRSKRRKLEFWEGTAALAIVTLITAGAHLVQITLWAAAFRLCGQVATFEAALYFSIQNYTALGYGDIQLSEPWRLLGPLESLHGLLFLGLSTAVLFAIMSQLIADRLHAETGCQDVVTGIWHSRPQAVAGSWERVDESGPAVRSDAEDA